MPGVAKDLQSSEGVAACPFFREDCSARDVIAASIEQQRIGTRGIVLPVSPEA